MHEVGLVMGIEILCYGRVFIAFPLTIYLFDCLEGFDHYF